MSVPRFLSYSLLLRAGYWSFQRHYSVTMGRVGWAMNLIAAAIPLGSRPSSAVSTAVGYSLFCMDQAFMSV